MNSQQELEKALASILTGGSENGVEIIARVIAQALETLRSSATQGDNQFVVSPEVEQALEELKGKEIKPLILLSPLIRVR